MKANELMIGNWVDIGVHGKYYRVEEIRYECGEYRAYIKDTAVYATDKELHPIRLTDEILVKNGFVKDGGVLHLKVNKKMCGDGFEIQEAIIHPRNIVVLITCVATIKMQCKYVHQLQNAFTQSEFNKDIVL